MHRVAALRRESKLKVAVVSVFAVALWTGAFLLARFGFAWLEAFGEDLVAGGALSLSQLVVSRLLSSFTLAVLVMLVVSNVLVSFVTFYRSDEMGLLMAAPLSWQSLFVARFAETVVFSSWSTAFLGSPVLLAYGLETGASPLFYLAAAVLFLPFVVIPAAAGSIVTLLLARFLGGRRRGPVLALAAAGAGAAFLIFRASLGEPRLAGQLSLTRLVEIVGRPKSPFLPSEWMAQGLLAASQGDLGETAFLLSVLIANGLLLVWLGAQAADRLLYPGWSAVSAGGEGGRRRLRISLLPRLEERLLPRRPGWALFVKDLKVFWRDPAQWSQFAIFFGILALYLANMKSSSSAYERELWQTWLTLLNLLALLLILATLTTRFVFPLVSLEGRRWWLLGLAPITRRQVVRQKLWLSLGCTFPFTLGLLLLSGLRLDLPPLPFFFSMFAMAAANVALAGLAVGLGSLYPDFEAESPARITSGMGGTLSFILSMGYILTSTATLTLLLHWDYVSHLLGAGTGSLAWAAIAILGFIASLSALTCWLPMRLGTHHLENVEL